MRILSKTTIGVLFLTGQVICDMIIPLHKRTQNLSGKFIHLTGTQRPNFKLLFFKIK
jgi:hypothetical protein